MRSLIRSMMFFVFGQRAHRLACKEKELQLEVFLAVKDRVSFECQLPWCSVLERGPGVQSHRPKPRFSGITQ